MLYPDLKDLIKLKSVVGYSRLLLEKTSNRTSGDYASLFHGLGVEFETVRPYVVGDDVRYIDWRVTARIGKPQIKTFRAESDRNVFIVVDANAYMRFGTRGTFKSVQAANTAAILCWKSLQQQDRVGGLIFGDIAQGIQYFKPSKTDGNILRFLKTLCAKEANLHEPVTISAALRHLEMVATPQSLIFILSDFSMDELTSIEKSLIGLRKKSKVILLPVHDQSDRDIPAIGPIIFASQQQQELIHTESAQGRKKYRQMWDNYTQALNNIGKKLKVPLLWIDTNIDPVKSLFSNAGSLLTWKN